MPRVTILVLAGVAIAAVVRLVSGYEAHTPTADIAESLIDVALVMVAFLLGGDLRPIPPPCRT